MSSGSTRQKNFRRRSEDDAIVDEKEKTSSSGTTTKGSTQAQARPRPRTTKLLSFADEEDQDEAPTPVRSSRGKHSLSSAKSSSTHKHTFTKDRASSGSPATPIPANVQPQTGEYTKEKLRELQKNARPLGSMPKPSSQIPTSGSSLEPQKATKPTDKPAETVVVLKGLVKPVVVEEKQEADERNEVGNQRFAKLGINEKGKDSSLIPDQVTINAIRAKRERMRQSRAAAPDYISLDGGGVASTRVAHTGGSSDEEDGDFRGRISLLGDNTKDSIGKKGVFEDVEEKDAVVEARMTVDNEDDEEERIWEEEQFRKGLGKRIDDSSTFVASNGGTSVVPTIQPPPPVYSQKGMVRDGPLAVSFGVSRSAEVLSIPQQAEIATRALKENVKKLKESHDRTLASLIKTEENLCESLSKITDFEKSLEAAGQKFVYMQELRNFLSVICDFLQEKTPYIEELEEHMQKLHKDRTSAIFERRAADIADEASEVEAAVNAAQSVLSKGSGSAYISAATTAAQAASAAAAKESSNLSVQLDEFGRDLNLQKRMDSERRAERKQRKKERSEAKRISIGGDSKCFLIEGECSTDESDTEIEACQSNQGELLRTANQIFSDAADEYSNLSVVKEKFEMWKRQYYASYRDAYMALSAPDIYSPYVRLELLRWDPLHVDLDFNDMKWHTELFDYGLRENESDFAPDDPDANLIPDLVEKVALPILHYEIEHCWDIFSTRKTRNAVSATRLVVNYLPSSSKALRNLLATVHDRLADAVNNFTVPTWGTNALKIVSDASQVAAYRFGTSVRLLRNICLWKDILSLQVLEEIALDKLLCGKVLPHLYVIMPNIHDAITRIERVVASLSGVWSGPKGENHQKLQPLVNCVVELGRKLEKRHAFGVSGDTIGLARRLKKMLVDLNEYDMARTISRTFQIKEAL